MIIKLDSENFNKEVIDSDKKVLVDFNADWCGPCRMLGPIVEEVASENDNVKIASLNIDKEDEIAEKYNISSIPCLIVFENGKEIKRSVGFIPKDKVEELIK